MTNNHKTRLYCSNLQPHKTTQHICIIKAEGKLCYIPLQLQQSVGCYRFSTLLCYSRPTLTGLVSTVSISSSYSLKLCWKLCSHKYADKYWNFLHLGQFSIKYATKLITVQLISPPKLKGLLDVSSLHLARTIMHVSIKSNNLCKTKKGV